MSAGHCVHFDLMMEERLSEDIAEGASAWDASWLRERVRLVHRWLVHRYFAESCKSNLVENETAPIG
jgi:hypothetical protein